MRSFLIEDKTIQADDVSRLVVVALKIALPLAIARGAMAKPLSLARARGVRQSFVLKHDNALISR